MGWWSNRRQDSERFNSSATTGKFKEFKSLEDSFFDDLRSIFGAGSKGREQFYLWLKVVLCVYHLDGWRNAIYLVYVDLRAYALLNMRNYTLRNYPELREEIPELGVDLEVMDKDFVNRQSREIEAWIVGSFWGVVVSKVSAVLFAFAVVIPAAMFIGFMGEMFWVTHIYLFVICVILAAAGVVVSMLYSPTKQLPFRPDSKESVIYPTEEYLRRDFEVAGRAGVVAGKAVVEHGDIFEDIQPFAVGVAKEDLAERYEWLLDLLVHERDWYNDKKVLPPIDFYRLHLAGCLSSVTPDDFESLNDLMLRVFYARECRQDYSRAVERRLVEVNKKCVVK